MTEGREWAIPKPGARVRVRKIHGNWHVQAGTDDSGFSTLAIHYGGVDAQEQAYNQAGWLRMLKKGIG